MTETARTIVRYTIIAGPDRHELETRYDISAVPVRREWVDHA